MVVNSDLDAILRQMAAEGLLEEAAKTIIDQMGVKPVIDQLEVRDIAAHLNAEQWEELLRLRQASPPPTKHGRKSP